MKRYGIYLLTYGIGIATGCVGLGFIESVDVLAYEFTIPMGIRNPDPGCVVCGLSLGLLALPALLHFIRARRTTLSQKA